MQELLSWFGVIRLIVILGECSMIKNNKRFPYGYSLKVCENCGTLDIGKVRKCRICGSKMILQKGWLYYGYKMEKY